MKDLGIAQNQPLNTSKVNHTAKSAPSASKSIPLSNRFGNLNDDEKEDDPNA